jgi:hypothetical protein
MVHVIDCVPPGHRCALVNLLNVEVSKRYEYLHIFDTNTIPYNDLDSFILRVNEPKPEHVMNEQAPLRPLPTNPPNCRTQR